MRRRLGTLGLAVSATAWVFICFALASLLIIEIYRALPDTSWLSGTLGQLLLNAVVYVVTVTLVLIPFWYRHKLTGVLKLLALDKRPGWNVLWMPLLLWPLYMIATTVAALLAQYLPWVDLDQAQDVGFSGLTQPYEYVVAFVALVILPPIAEEVLFRGYLFGRLRPHMRFWMSAIIVSAAFGFVHGQWNIGIDTFILSLFLCYLRESTGSLWAPMILHAIKNGLAYALLFIAPLLGYQLL